MPSLTVLLHIKAFFRRALLALLWLAAVTSWAAIGLLVTFSGPEEGTNELLFFVLLLVASSSTTTIVAYTVSFRVFALKRYQGSLVRAVIQGVPVGLFVAMAAWLQALRLLNWDAVLIALGIVFVLELLLLPRGAT